MRDETKNLAFAAVISALGTVLLCLGAVIPFSTYACPAIASAAVLIVNEEGGRKYALCSYAVVSALSVMLSPDKEAALIFVFLGYYPVFKASFDRLRPRGIRIAAKLGLCAAAMSSLYALLILVFRLEAVVREFQETAPFLLAATAALGGVTFLAYDLALQRITHLYRSRRGIRK